MDTCTIRQALYFFGEVLVGERYVQPERFGTLKFAGCAGGTEDGGSDGVGQLNGCGANTTTCRVNEHTLAHLQSCLRKEGVVGGHEDFWYACCFHKAQVFWYLDKCALLSKDVFSLPSASRYAHNALPWLPRGGERTNGINLTGKFETRDVCR